MKRILAITASILFLFPLVTFGKTVKASSFGFDPKDATKCLQEAINSGAKEVIIDYTGKDYIVTKTVMLRSNLTITIEDKVVIKAGKGAFKGLRPMFRREGGKNITIQGKGNARIEMRRSDYRNPKLYQQGEHRHIFWFASLDNVIIRNLTLAESGGDGIYFGGYLKRKPYCKNILVENVRFTGHNRLGIAVISGEDVIIRNCSFENAAGAPPQGGIDLEPNKPDERLVNILIENCTFNNNKGGALSVAPTKLNVNSLPISVTIRNCKFGVNGQDMYLQNLHDHKNVGHISVKGTVTLENCENNGSLIQLLTPVEHVLYNFKNCTFRSNAKGNVFEIRVENGGKIPVGNIRFQNCVVKLPAAAKESNIFRFNYTSKSLLGDKMGGTLYVEQNGKKKLFDFAPVIKREQKRFANLYKYDRAIFNEKLLKIPAKDAVRKNNENMHFRNAEFIQYAKKGDKINLTLKAKKTGYDAFISYTLKSPSGKLLEKGSIAPDTRKEVSFVAEETGLYRFSPKSFNSYDVISSHKGSAWLMTRSGFDLIYPNGYLYFQVPANITEFVMGFSFYQAPVKLKNGKMGKRGFVRVRDGKGKIVKNIRDGKFTIHTFKRAKTSANEIYSIEIRDMGWNTGISFYTPLQPLVSTNKATFFQ